MLIFVDIYTDKRGVPDWGCAGRSGQAGWTEALSVCCAPATCPCLRSRTCRSERTSWRSPTPRSYCRWSSHQSSSIPCLSERNTQFSKIKDWRTWLLILKPMKDFLTIWILQSMSVYHQCCWNYIHDPGLQICLRKQKFFYLDYYIHLFTSRKYTIRIQR